MITERALYGDVEVEAYYLTTTEYPATVVYSQGFEGGTGGWTAGVSVVIQPGMPRTGTGALGVRRTSNGTAQVTRTITGLTAGLTYTFEAYVGRSDGSVTNAQAYVPGVASSSMVNPVTGSTSTLVTFTFVATGTTAFLVMNTSHSSTSETASWDDVKVIRNAYSVTAETWNPLVHDATNLSIRRGGTRDGFGIKTDVGLCTFRLLNAQDPMDGGSLKPGLNVRVMSADAPIFTGRIAHLNSVYPLNKQTGQSRAVTEVTVADAVQIHGSTMRYGVDLGVETNETFEERIERLEASANAPIEVPVAGDPIVKWSL